MTTMRKTVFILLIETLWFHTSWMEKISPSLILSKWKLRFFQSSFPIDETCSTITVRLVTLLLSQLYLYPKPTWRRALYKLRSKFWKLLYTSRRFHGVWVVKKRKKTHTAAHRHHPILIPLSYLIVCTCSLYL